VTLRRLSRQLPDALPSVSHVLLSTLFGLDEAMRVAAGQPVSSES
jgi:hypothetical protein